MNDQKVESKTTASVAAKPIEKKRAPKTDKGEIPTGLSYVNATGVLSKILAKIIEAPSPERITQDYLANVWNFSGGSAMAVIPFLKKIDFLSSDGTPTDNYRNFRTQNRRNEAISHGLRTGFPDIYKQTDFAENAKEEKIADIVIGITGRSKTDQTVRAIIGSFKSLTDFINKDEKEITNQQNKTEKYETLEDKNTKKNHDHSGFNLGYQINIVLPETKDIEVFDAIFKKLKEHLL